MDLKGDFFRGITSSVDMTPLTPKSMLEKALKASYAEISSISQKYPHATPLKVRLALREIIGFDTDAILMRQEDPEKYERKFGDRNEVSDLMVRALCDQVHTWCFDLTDNNDQFNFDFNYYASDIGTLKTVMYRMVDGYSAEQAAKSTYRNLHNYRSYDPAWDFK